MTFWLPLDGECFALWSDRANVSFCFLKSQHERQQQRWLLQGLGIARRRFCVTARQWFYSFNAFLTDDSNLMVVPSHCRTEESLRALDAHLRGAPSNFLLNFEWKTVCNFKTLVFNMINCIRCGRRISLQV